MGSLLPVVKLATSVLAGIPVGKIANDIIKNNVTVVTKVDKVKVVTGSVVIGMMISESLSKTTDKLVDTVVSLKNHSKSNEETKETTEI